MDDEVIEAMARAMQQAAKSFGPGRPLADNFSAALAQAALSALAEKGYVVVPKEVTPAMQKAYFDVIDSNLRRVETDAGFGRHDNMRLAYRAMLSASQPPS